MLDKTSRPCLCFEHCERFEELASYFSPYGVLVSVLASLGKFTCIVLLFMHSCFIVEWSLYRWHWSEFFSSRKLFLQLLQHLKQQQHKQYLKNSFKFEYDKTKTKPITYRLHYSGNLKIGIKPKPNQLLTDNTTQATSNRSKTKTKSITTNYTTQATSKSE